MISPRHVLVLILAGCMNCAAITVEDFCASAMDHGDRPEKTLVQQGLLLLDSPYQAGTLGGGVAQPESLTVRLDSLDCMTFLENLLAASRISARSDSISFAGELQKLRYRNGEPAWENRRHFFSDWAAELHWLKDAGADFPGSSTIQLQLNERGSGKVWLEGIHSRERVIHHVPPAQASLDSLRDGDLLGFRTRLAGLDVTHTGLLVRQQGEAWLLHASSKAGKVVLERLADYPGWKQGVMVIRLVD